MKLTFTSHSLELFRSSPLGWAKLIYNSKKEKEKKRKKNGKNQLRCLYVFIIREYSLIITKYQDIFSYDYIIRDHFQRFDFNFLIDTSCINMYVLSLEKTLVRYEVPVSNKLEFATFNMFYAHILLFVETRVNKKSHIHTYSSQLLSFYFYFLTYLYARILSLFYTLSPSFIICCT